MPSRVVHTATARLYLLAPMDLDLQHGGADPHDPAAARLACANDRGTGTIEHIRLVATHRARVAAENTHYSPEHGGGTSARRCSGPLTPWQQLLCFE